MVDNQLEQGDILSFIRVRLATIAYLDILLCSIRRFLGACSEVTLQREEGGETQGNRILSCSGEHRQQVVFVETT